MNDEDAEKISIHLKEDFWNYNPETYDTDYGDSEFLGMANPEIKIENSSPFVID